LPVPSPEVSVVIPTRNRHASLRRTLTALAGQRTARDFEIVVVDDGSTPPVGPAELSVAPQARVVPGPRRGRAAGARNAGIAAADGALVLFTDDDTEPEPDWLEAAAGFLSSHPDHVGVEGPVASTPFDPLYAYSIEADGPGSYVTCNLAFRAEVLAEIGGFDDEAFAFHCEDLDLAFRAMRRGPIGFAPGMRILHHPRPMSLGEMVGRGRMTVNEIELFTRHRERFGRAAKLPPRVFPVVSAVHVALLLAPRAGLHSPRRIARYAAYVAGYLANVVAAVALSGRTARRTG
jgi:GT2 family glycosyltransferase